MKRLPIGSRVVIPFGYGGAAGVVTGYMGWGRTVVRTDKFGYRIEPNRNVSLIQNDDPSYKEF